MRWNLISNLFSSTAPSPVESTTNTVTRRATSPPHVATTEKQEPIILRLIKARDICLITRQLATLLKAGMPLLPAFKALLEQFDSQQIRQQQLHRVLLTIHDRIAEGANFSDALREYPTLFSRLYCSMIQAGESSGTLDEVLERLADNLEKHQVLTGKIKASLTYPILMTIVAVGVVFFLLAHVVPSLTNIFQEMNRSLPLPTQLLIHTSDFCQKHAILIVVFLISVGIGLIALRTSARTRPHWDRWILRIPLLGPFIIQVELARLTRTLGMLLAGGVPILKAMVVTEGTIQNTTLSQAWIQIREQVQKGQGLAESMKQTNLLPPVVCHMINTSQNTGTLETGLLRIADMNDSQLENTLKSVTALIEPLILLIMGTIVGFVVMAMLLPIFEINQAI